MKCGKSSFEALLGTDPNRKVEVTQKKDVKQAKVFGWTESASSHMRTSLEPLLRTDEALGDGTESHPHSETLTSTHISSDWTLFLLPSAFSKQELVQTLLISWKGPERDGWSH